MSTFSNIKIYRLLPALVLLAACGNKSIDSQTSLPEVTTPGVSEQTATQSWPQFNADSAYSHIERQVSFGPRVPGSTAHRRCADYLTDRFKAYGADTLIHQQATVKAYNGDRLPMHNILARFNIAAPRRILIAAHYDTRPWADNDADKSNHSTAIDGANDGASGVAVALELARNIGSSNPTIGIDFLMVDVEDYGSSGDDSSWALGAQHWMNNPTYMPTQRPAYGIVLDMVGGRDAKFYREYFSEANASWLNSKIWAAAAMEGVTRFVNEQRGGVTDDHLYIVGAGIPCVDIIECAHPETGAFNPTWHTVADNLENIDIATLADVGRTLMRLIYTESAE